MPYVETQDGKVVGIFARAQYPKQTFMKADDPAVLEHLGLSPAKVEQARVQNLKAEARAGLASEIGDLGDNITDTLRCMVLGRAIVNGTVTDERIIKRYDDYCALLLAGYDGAEAIMDVLESDAVSFKKWIIDFYYVQRVKSP